PQGTGHVGDRTRQASPQVGDVIGGPGDRGHGLLSRRLRPRRVRSPPRRLRGVIEARPEGQRGEERDGGCEPPCRHGSEGRAHRTPPRQWPASVATSFQLGSREVTSRAKVHTAVTSVTLSGLPSITVPDLSRVVDTNWETNRTVICAPRPRSSAAVMSAESIATKRVSTVSPRLSRSRMTLSKLSWTSFERRSRK